MKKIEGKIQKVIRTTNCQGRMYPKELFEKCLKEYNKTYMNLVEFKKELEQLINKYSIENMSDTPDFLLADFIMASLTAYGATVKARDKWYGIDNSVHTHPLEVGKECGWAPESKECCGGDCGCKE